VFPVENDDCAQAVCRSESLFSTASAKETADRLRHADVSVAVLPQGVLATMFWSWQQVPV
jgi:hypothetical protein